MSNRIQSLALVVLGVPVMALALAAATVNADTIYVCWDGSGDYLTIQEGIDAAQDGDEVVVCDGTYTGEGNRDLDFGGRLITVRSENGPENCIIDCEGSAEDPHRGFYFHSGESEDAVLDGLTICDGYVTGDSPGGNYGGAVYCYNNSSPTISNCTISRNTVEAEPAYGGGICCVNASPTITHCTITGNATLQYWGYRGDGGGVYCNDSSPTIGNCTITGNLADWAGGGIYCWGSEATISNCTITGNTVTGYAGGGGVYCANSSPTITNCILWADTPQEVFVYSGTPTVTYCDVQGGWAGEGNIDVDPVLTRDRTHLQFTSSCRDAGDPDGDYGEQTDIDGEPRVINGRVDMGADEWLDIDDDGLPDFWEQLYFGSPTGGDPLADDDGDGLINLDEYALSRNPLQGPATFYVDPDGDDSWDGLAPEWDGEHGPKATIQAAIDAAAYCEGDEVLAADGTYTGDGNRDLDFGGKLIAVRSRNGPENCIVDCQGGEADPHRGFCFDSGESADAVVDGFTITNGYAAHGAAVSCYNSSPTIADCAIAGNSADERGAGVYCVAFSSPTIVNCTMAGNMSNFNGGGVYCEGFGSPTIINCTITGNVADRDGGGIYCGGSEATISNCTITENVADNGGGICLRYDSEATISNCTITGNTAGDGGGIRCISSSPTISNCTISGNTAHGYYFRYGGGICLGGYGSEATISNCTITGNTGGEGGGLYCQGSGLTLTNCTITGNTGTWTGGVSCEHSTTAKLVNCTITGNSASAYSGAGAVNCRDCNPTLVNCTITGNTANGGGAAVYCRQSSSPTLTNCILWADTPQEIFVVSGSPVVTYCDVQGGWSGMGNIDADPLFVDPDGPDDDPNTWEDNNHHLSPASPCIDAGCNWGVPPDVADLDEDGDTSEITPLDLDGEGRFFDDADTADTGCGCPPIVDMGAYEFGDTGPQPCPGDLDCDRVVGHSDLGTLLGAWEWSDEGDLDCDGDTDHSDLGILLAHWGEGCP